jgi:predicted DNA-binding protein (UPF0278 family)
MAQHYYIDTDYLTSYLLYKDKETRDFLEDTDVEKARYEGLKRLITNRNTNIEFKIPFIVFGEFFNTLKSKGCFEVKNENAMNIVTKNISKLFDEHHNVDMIPSKSEKCYDYAKEIVKPGRIKHTDALIVSHALDDKEAIYILTKDIDIGKSFGEKGEIHNIIERINSNLKIYKDQIN